ncbi:MAG: BTAD domain-containing putative transcriptional regulator, partial [Actinomycetota bacterium]
MVAIRVLGGVRLEAPATDRLSARHRLVLALLAARYERAVDDDTLIDAIWGERPPKSARTALQTYVSELRDLLEPDRPRRSAGRFIHTDGTTYQLLCGPDDLDLAAFEADLDRATSAIEFVDLDTIELHEGTSIDEVTSALDRVVQAGGRPFGDLADHERLVGVVARLDERFVAAVEARAAIALSTGGGAELVDTLSDAVRTAPFRERVAGQLALCRYRGGDRTGALDELRSLARRLRDDLGLDPGPEITDLERALLDHDTDRLRPDRTEPEDAPVSAGRRRWSLAPMFGRDQLVDDVGEQLDRWPLVALTGPGGIGKSTIARAVLDRQPDGVALALVDVSELSDPTVESLVRAIANALG